jgi:hypothetical protein
VAAADNHGPIRHRATVAAGILVIALATKQTFEHPETGASMNPEEFLAVLRTVAARVEQHLGFGVRIGVRILDLRPRLAKP